MPRKPRESVVGHLLQQLAEAPFRVVPERAIELLELTKRHNVVFTFDRETQPEVHVNGSVIVGVSEAERLWAAAYAYTELLNVIADQGGRSGATINLDVDPSHQSWRGLLSWSMRGRADSNNESWPVDLPKPTLDAQPGTIVCAATERFLMMGGWMLLHEIGHLVNDHHARMPTSDGERHKLEYEADDWAATWLLEGCRSCSGEDEEREFERRAIGATFALCTLASEEVYDRQGACRTHPDPAKRLLRFLDRNFPESDAMTSQMADVPWYVAMVVYQLHMVNSGKTVARPGGYRGMREFILDAMCALGT